MFDEECFEGVAATVTNPFKSYSHCFCDEARQLIILEGKDEAEWCTHTHTHTKEKTAPHPNFSALR
jgi:hypothetical protein